MSDVECKKRTGRLRRLRRMEMLLGHRDRAGPGEGMRMARRVLERMVGELSSDKLDCGR